MMETNLNNIASVLGNYNSIPTQITSEVLVVSMISGLTVTKTADKMVWGDGKLTYTIEVNKTATQLASDDQTQLQVVDALGSALKYNENGVKIVKIDSGWKETDITNTCKVEIDHEKNITRCPAGTGIHVSHVPFPGPGTGPAGEDGYENDHPGLCLTLCNGDLFPAGDHEDRGDEPVRLLFFLCDSHESNGISTADYP